MLVQSISYVYGSPEGEARREAAPALEHPRRMLGHQERRQGRQDEGRDIGVQSAEGDGAIQSPTGWKLMYHDTETAARRAAPLEEDREPLGPQNLRAHLARESAALVSIALMQSPRFITTLGFSFTAELGHPASMTMAVTGHRNEVQMRADYTLVDSVTPETRTDGRDWPKT